MPSGRVHHDLWKRGWVVEGVTSIGLLLYYPSTSVGTVAGYFLGQFITPDADLVGVTYGEGRMLRKIPILGAFFLAYWTFYGAVFRKQHRSFWTHGFLISTAIRFLYGFWWIYFFDYWEIWFIEFLIGMFLGLGLSDTIHILADKFLGGR